MKLLLIILSIMTLSCGDENSKEAPQIQFQVNLGSAAALNQEIRIEYSLKNLDNDETLSEKVLLGPDSKALIKIEKVLPGQYQDQLRIFYSNERLLAETPPQIFQISGPFSKVINKSSGINDKTIDSDGNGQTDFVDILKGKEPCKTMKSYCSPSGQRIYCVDGLGTLSPEESCPVFKATQIQRRLSRTPLDFEIISSSLKSRDALVFFDNRFVSFLSSDTLSSDEPERVIGAIQGKIGSGNSLEELTPKTILKSNLDLVTGSDSFGKSYDLYEDFYLVYHNQNKEVRLKPFWGTIEASGFSFTPLEGSSLINFGGYDPFLITGPFLSKLRPKAPNTKQILGIDKIELRAGNSLKLGRFDGGGKTVKSWALKSSPDDFESGIAQKLDALGFYAQQDSLENQDEIQFFYIFGSDKNRNELRFHYFNQEEKPELVYINDLSYMLEEKTDRSLIWLKTGFWTAEPRPDFIALVFDASESNYKVLNFKPLLTRGGPQIQSRKITEFSELLNEFPASKVSYTEKINYSGQKDGFCMPSKSSSDSISILSFHNYMGLIYPEVQNIVIKDAKTVIRCKSMHYDDDQKSDIAVLSETINGDYQFSILQSQ